MKVILILNMLFCSLLISAQAQSPQEAEVVESISKSLLNRDYEKSAQLVITHQKMMRKNKRLKALETHFYSSMCSFRNTQKKWVDAAYWCREAYLRSDGKLNEAEVKNISELAHTWFLEAYAMEDLSPRLAIQKYKQVVLLQWGVDPYYTKSLSRLSRMYGLTR